MAIHHNINSRVKQALLNTRYEDLYKAAQGQYSMKIEEDDLKIEIRQNTKGILTIVTTTDTMLQCKVLPLTTIQTYIQEDGY